MRSVSIFSIKQCLIEFEINPHQRVSRNCNVQQSASHILRRSSTHKPVRLESEIKFTAIGYSWPCSMPLIPKSKCFKWVNHSYMHPFLWWLLAYTIKVNSQGLTFFVIFAKYSWQQLYIEHLALNCTMKTDVAITFASTYTAPCRGVALALH